MCFHTRNYLYAIRYDIFIFTIGMFTRSISWFHEYSMLCCDDPKDYIYSMKYDAFISPIYVWVYINMYSYKELSIYNRI